MLPCALDFRICSDSVRAARASFAALSQAVAVAPLSDALAERLRVLAPGGQAAAGLLRFSYEAFRHGLVTIIEARLAPGDQYLDFVAALQAERPHLQARHQHGWPVLFLPPMRASDASGEENMTTPIEEVVKDFSVDPRLLRPEAGGGQTPPAIDAATAAAAVTATLQELRGRSFRRSLR